MSQRVVGITGSTGFVGINLSPFLKGAGFQVTDMDMRKGYNKAMLGRLDAVIHLAGKAHDLKGGAHLEEYMRVNTGLTQMVFDDFLRSPASIFIFLSSIKALADYAPVSLHEEFNAYPQSNYGISKRKAEEYILAQALPQGKQVYILRPCMIHGPGNKGNLNLLFQFVKKGMPYPLARYENQRSFLSIDNLCFVIGEILRRNDIPSGIYHISDTEAISTNELITLIAEEMGVRARLWRIPSGLIRSAAALGDQLRLPLNTDRLKKLTESYMVDNSKIRNALGQELPMETRAGLRKTIASFQV